MATECQGDPGLAGFQHSRCLHSRRGSSTLRSNSKYKPVLEDASACGSGHPLPSKIKKSSSGNSHCYPPYLEQNNIAKQATKNPTTTSGNKVLIPELLKLTEPFFSSKGGSSCLRTSFENSLCREILSTDWLLPFLSPPMSTSASSQ